MNKHRDYYATGDFEIITPNDTQNESLIMRIYIDEPTDANDIIPDTLMDYDFKSDKEIKRYYIDAEIGWTSGADILALYCCDGAKDWMFDHFTSGESAYDEALNDTKDWENHLEFPKFKKIDYTMHLDKLRVHSDAIVDEVMRTADMGAIYEWYDNGHQFQNGGYDSDFGYFMYEIEDENGRQVLLINYERKKARLCKPLPNFTHLDECYEDYINDNGDFESNIDYSKALTLLTDYSFRDIFEL